MPRTEKKNNKTSRHLSSRPLPNETKNWKEKIPPEREQE